MSQPVTAGVAGMIVEEGRGSKVSSFPSFLTSG